MITGEEGIYADPARGANQSHSNQEPLNLHQGITLKQHMVIEFTKSSEFYSLPTHVQETICQENAPSFSMEDPFDGVTEIRQTYGEPYAEWLIRGKVKYAIMQANEVIKQLNEDEKETSNSKDGIS